MRLTIIQPCMGRRLGEKYIRTWQMEPLAPAVLAALTPPEITIAFFDDRMETIDYDAPTDLVAITVETYTAKRAYQIASAYRRRGVTVVMGGFHATLQPDEVGHYAEAVVVGEAEGVWPQLLADFAAGHLQRRYQSTERPQHGGTRPDRTIFAGKNYLPITLVESGRGCRLACEFCAIQSAFAGSYASRPIADIVGEIAGLPNQMVFFVDDNFIADPQRARELLRALIPLKIRWIGQAAITAAFDEELLQLLQQSGCQGLLIGLESLDPQTLLQMGKGFVDGAGYYERALANLARYGIRIYATFIFGYDNDDAESLRQALDFARRQRFYLTAFNHITPFPGTPLYRRLQQEGRLLFARWWLDDGYRYGMLPFTPRRITPQALEEGCIAARGAFFSLGSMLRRSFDFAVNSRTLWMWFNFFVINGLMRREVQQRRRYPLGDEAFAGELLPVADVLQGERR